MCLGLLCCLCGPGACGLCCCKGKVKSSITTRLLYFTFLLGVLIVTSFMLSPAVADGLQNTMLQLALYIFPILLPPSHCGYGNTPQCANSGFQTTGAVRLCETRRLTSNAETYLLELITPSKVLNSANKYLLEYGECYTALFCVSLNKTIPNAPSFFPGFHVKNLVNCYQFVGYLAAYRVCMAVAAFFLILTAVMICVRSSKDPRAYLQNGFWFFKWLFVIGLVVAFFLIPEGVGLAFSKTAMGIGLTGSTLFIVFQIIFLVDFAHSWAENWIGRAEENENKWWYVLMLVVSVVFYVGSLVGIILLYVFFTESSSCSLNKFFISSVLILSVIVSVVAILPWVQRVQPKSGLLQASIVTAYCTYITWSAISTEPYGAVPNTNNTQFYNCRRLSSTFAVYGHGRSSSIAASAVGIGMLFLTVAYMCFNLSGHRQIRKLQGKKLNGEEDDEGLLGEPVYVTNDSGASDDEDSDESKWAMGHTDDEKETVTYSYSFFHFMMMLAVLFFMMQLTNWADPGSANTEQYKSSWAATWVQVVSAWLCFVVYLWTLVAPLVLGRCRDFDYD